MLLRLVPSTINPVQPTIILEVTMPSFATPVYGTTDETAHRHLIETGAVAAWRATVSYTHLTLPTNRLV